MDSEPIAQVQVDSIPEQFRFERVLNDDSTSKTVSLLGEINGNPTIINIEKLHFNLPIDAEKFSTSLIHTQLSFTNDIYSQYNSGLTLFPNIKINVISPCTETHIRKYSRQQVKWILETPEMYKDITFPYINSIPCSRIQWVYNILSGKAEVDRILFNDKDEKNGFILLPDFKWDQITLSNLYLVVIVRRETLKSIRDLRQMDLPLLRKVREKVHKVIKDRYGLDENDIKMFFHYQPSYYHLHIHVTAVGNLMPSMMIGHSIPLDTVIDLISLMDNYYERAILPMVLGSNHDLYKEFKNRGYFT